MMKLKAILLSSALALTFVFGASVINTASADNKKVDVCHYPGHGDGYKKDYVIKYKWQHYKCEKSGGHVISISENAVHAHVSNYH